MLSLSKCTPDCISFVCVHIVAIYVLAFSKVNTCERKMSIKTEGFYVAYDVQMF